MKKNKKNFDGDALFTMCLMGSAYRSTEESYKCDKRVWIS